MPAKFITPYKTTALHYVRYSYYNTLETKNNIQLLIIIFSFSSFTLKSQINARKRKITIHSHNFQM